jgi:hypothetical protein
MISKLLVGVTGQRNAKTRQVVHMLNDQLNLIHVNIRQPFIDVLAAVTGKTSQVAATMGSDEMIPSLKCKVSAFEREYMAAVYGLNKDYFIEAAAEKLTRTTAGFTQSMQHLFDGYIVSGISRPQEANFVRDRGGVMVHLQEGPGFTDFHPLSTRLYDVIFNVRDVDLSKPDSIANVIQSIKESHRKVA